MNYIVIVLVLKVKVIQASYLQVRSGSENLGGQLLIQGVMKENMEWGMGFHSPILKCTNKYFGKISKCWIIYFFYAEIIIKATYFHYPKTNEKWNLLPFLDYLLVFWPCF